MNAPKLQKIKLVNWNRNSSAELFLDLVHWESVERLITSRTHQIEVAKLANLKYFYCAESLEVISNLLATLEQLQEIQLYDRKQLQDLFELKKQNRRNLKIFFRGCLVDGPSDPVIDSLSLDPLQFQRFPPRSLGKCAFDYLAKNPEKLADEIPFFEEVQYLKSDCIREAELGVLNRLTDLETICLH